MSDLTFARLSTVAITAVVTANSYLVAYISREYGLTLVDLMPKFFNMFAGPMARCSSWVCSCPTAPRGRLSRRVLIGLVVSFLWSWWQVLFRTSYSPTIFLAIAVPCVTTFLLAAALGVFLKPRTADAGRDFTWRAIVRRIPLSSDSAG